MACTNPLLSIDKNCDPAPGGVAQLIYGNNETVAVSTVSVDGEITAFTHTEQAETITPRRESIQVVETPNVNFDNGVTTNTATITINLVGRNVALVKAINRIIEGQRELYFVAKQNTGKYLYLRNVRYSGGEGNTGMKFQDGDKEQMVLTGEYFAQGNLGAKAPYCTEAAALALLT